MEFTTTPGATPVLISVHVLPPSCVRQKCGLKSFTRIVFAAAYAVAASKWPASMLKMRVHGLIADGVTFVHFLPPSVVTWMLPSSVPAHSTLMLLGLGEKAVIVPSGAGVTPLAYLPAFVGTAHVCRARSGLTRVQLCARSVVFHTAFDT